MKNGYAYIGNWGFWSEEKEFGITVCKYGGDGKELQKVDTCLEGAHVGCICINEKKKILYCVDERIGMPELGGKEGGGRVFALKIDPVSGKLTELNHQPAFAPLPTYCTLNEEGTALVVVSHSGVGRAVTSEQDAFGNYCLKIVYSDSPTVLYPLGEDGSILPPSDIYKHSMRKTDCGELHPVLHSVVKAPSENLYFVCDIGTHQIYTFRIEGKSLKVCGKFEAPIGSAPRYGCVHGQKPFYYCNHEILPEVAAFLYDKEGKLTFIESVSVLPREQEDADHQKKESSDLKIHPNGRFLYNILRGVNMVSVMEINQETGDLRLIQNVSFDATSSCCGGPRGCQISPDGKYFYICVADDETVIRYDLGENGLLQGNETRFSMGNPANLVFLEAK